jgi:hypothetical protein
MRGLYVVVTGIAERMTHSANTIKTQHGAKLVALCWGFEESQDV